LIKNSLLCALSASAVRFLILISEEERM